MLRIFGRIGAWVRRSTNKEIDVCDLPSGEYTLVCSSDVQVFIGWRVYDQRSRVKLVGGLSKKTWTVLSTRHLPQTFRVDKHGDIRKVA